MAISPKNNHFIAILCGGTGPRLWPVSRASNPKQFLKILSPNSSFLQDAIKRALWLVPKQNIYIITNKRYQKEIKKDAAILPKENFLYEPRKRNTALAMIWSTTVIAKNNPDATITHFASDHFVKGKKQFIKNLKDSVEIANKKSCLVTIGIKPTWPNPAYGYIHIGQKDSQKGFFQCLNFTEKPDKETAKKYIKTKKYLWNANFYTWTVKTLKEELRKHNPDYLKLYNTLEKGPQNPKIIKKVYKTNLHIAIDKAISEKTKNLKVIPANFAWSDIGEWGSIHEIMSNGKPGPVNLNGTQSVNVDSQNLIIKADPQKMVGTVGVKDLAIIDTPDALLVCSLKDSFKVRELVGEIVKKKKNVKYFEKQSHER